MRRVRLCLVAAVVALMAAPAALAAAAPSAPSPGDPARSLRDSLFRDFGASEAGDPRDEPRGLSALLWADDPGEAPDASSWITECASISPNATGNLSDANGTGCVLPANETSVVPSGSRIAGEGSLVLPEGAVLTCADITEYCALTVALGADARLVLDEGARLSAGFLNVTAGVVGLGKAARLDADGRGDPGERRGWSGDGGAGYGGDGAACPAAGSALPPRPGGAGYAFQEFINVGRAWNGKKGLAPPPQGTAAGGAGGGAVVVVARTLRFGDGAAVSADGAAPAPGAAHAGGGSGGSVVVFAGEVVAASEDAATRGIVRAGGGAGAAQDGGGGGGGGGRVALLAPSVWPPSVRVGAGGGRSGGACGAAGFHGGAGTTLNAASGALVVSNADPLSGRVAPAPAACLADGAWGACAVTRLTGALPLQGIASLRVADGAVACTDVCGASSAPGTEDAKASRSRWFARGLLGGDGGGGGGGGGVVHLEVSESVALTGDAHLLHGGSAPSLAAGSTSSLSAASSTLWVVSPSVSVADKSSIRVLGAASVDGGPAGTGSLSVRGGGSVRVLPAPPDAKSYVFNVATVRVDSGGSLVVDGAGALSVTGRGEDVGSLTVGDEDDGDARAARGTDASAASEMVAGRLVVDRFGAVRVRRGGIVRATSDATFSGAEDDAQCSSTRCPAYVFGEEKETFVSGAFRTPAAFAADGAVPCQTGAASPFALQLCHGGAVDVDGGGVVSASAVHVYGVGEVRIGRGALHADAAGCRAGEGEGRGESFADGAGAGGGYGGVGGDGFTPDSSRSLVARTSVSVSNGTTARGGAAYGDAAAPCSASAAHAGSLGSGGGAGAGAGYGGAGGGLLVVGAARRPAAALVVGAGGRLSANGGDGGKAVTLLAADALAGLGYGGGGSGGTVLVFSKSFAVDPGGRVAADGGAGAGGASGAEGGGGGGGGGRVHLEWAKDGTSGAGAAAPSGTNRTAPDGTVTADGGGGGGAEPGAEPGASPDFRSARGAAGTVTASACAPGFAGLLCAPCLPGTYKEGTGNGACTPCAPIPRRAAFVDPSRSGTGGAGATTRECPYECVGSKSLVYPACATRAEAAVAAVGGPAAAGAALAAVVLCATLPLSAVVGRARAAERRALERERLSYGGRGGSRGGGRLGSLAFPPPGLGGWREGRFAVSSRSRKRGSFANASSTSGLSTPFLRGRDSPYSGSGSGSPADADAAHIEAGSVPNAFLGRVYFTGANAFGNPWRLPPPPPPAVQPLLHAEEWARLVRACATGAPASWGEGQGPRRGAGTPESFPQTRGRAERNAKKKNFGGASRARWRGFVDALLGVLFVPGQTWWRAFERRRVAACLHALVDVYDRRCLRSARARALQEGLAFGCSDDARVAWLDFFAQGDEEDAFLSDIDIFSAEAIDDAREDRGERAKKKEESFRGRKEKDEHLLADHLPLVVVFSGEGSFRAPWRWETAPETAAGEGLPAAALRRAVPPATLAVAAREVRAALRRCRRVSVPAAASAAEGTGIRRRVERRRGRGGGGGASFALAGGDFFGSDSDARGAARPARYAHTGSASSSGADTRGVAPTFSRSDAFLRVDGADALARVLETSVNAKLRAHGVALALAAFEPPEDDPFGGFQLGLLGVPAELDEEEAFGFGDPSLSFGGAAREAFVTFENDSPDGRGTRGREVFEAARSESSPALPLSTPPPFNLSREIDEAGVTPALQTRDVFARESSDEDVSSDVERAPFIPRAEEESGGESHAGSFVETTLRGAAAWAMAAATSTSPARAESRRRAEPAVRDRFQSLRALATPRAEDARGAPRLTPSARKHEKAFSETRGPPGRNAALADRRNGAERNASTSTPRAAQPASPAAGESDRAGARASATLAAAPLGTVLYVPPAARQGGLSRSTEKKQKQKHSAPDGPDILRTWFRRASIFSPSPRGSRARLAAALVSAALVAVDAVASFAVLAQTLECDGGARLSLVLSSPPLALPLAPVAGAAALCLAALGPSAGGSTFAESARAARAYAAWTLDAVVAVFVAFLATALARSGVDALGSRCGDRGGRFGGALSADGAAWFAPPIAAAVAKLAAAAAAAARAADLDEKEEEASAASARADGEDS